ncbi:dynamin family protein [Pectobacterium brasiliense]|uniref:dynamin family protein n=1 Tax=Pectobacterium brasiliense TaxID=180957 RepID=UPI001968B3E6|nr:dynamin family protein [Pectobacterium brasiliense]QSD35327.1 dynamin family protein [Pectobacterium brasiliense]
MHENNITLLCNETERLLQLNINLLQKMVDEPNVLLENKQKNNEQLFNKSKAIKRIEELQGERTKITRKEMVLAVVGTMKAGKSTTINAIVGKEILPNRNRPMTSIPTLIRHVPGKHIPDLQLNNIDPIHQLLTALKNKITTDEGKKRVLELDKDQEKSKLLRIATDDSWLKNNYAGEAEIFTCLASLNDLVRLATALNVEFPFEAYEEVHELPVIEVEFSHLTGMDDSQGTLTLLDTPGPNEAGQPQLQAMMRDQLQKASAVLAVLDYTQLNSEADQQVRAELNDIANVAAGRLFVLVNKFDQQDRNSDNAETVKQSVPAMLEHGVLNSDRVYPGSSRHAYLANRARSVISQAGTLSGQEEWVEDFAQLAFGLSWEEEDLASPDDVRRNADKIWRRSLFDKLITEVIQAAHAKAAALAVDSAAAKLVQNAENANEYLSVRHQGLLTSIQTLQNQINGLLSDIDNIATCQKDVDAEVKRAMKGITRETDALLEQAEKTLSEDLNEYFKNGKRQEKEALELDQPKESASLTIFGTFIKTLTGTVQPRERDFDPKNPEMKFSARSDAEKFIQQIEDSVTSLLAETEEKIKPTLTEIVADIEKSFHGNALQAVEKIAHQINTRLEDDGFTVNIHFPKVSQLQTNLSIRTRMASLLEEKTFSETKRRRSSGAWGTVCKWFNTDDWGWEDYNVHVTRSVVDIRKIKTAVKKQTKEHFAELNETIDAGINQPILAEIESFFGAFKGKVEQLRNTLIQSTEDHKNSQNEQEQLTLRLRELKKLTPEMIRDGKALKEELEPML